LFIAWAGAAIVLVALDRLFPPPGPKPYSTVVQDAAGEPVHIFLSSDDKWRLYTPLRYFGKEIPRALLHKEDQYFYYHPGVNPLALVRAAANNVLAGKRTSGASTITMQVARMLEPKPRTYAAKLMEMLRALQLELHYNKREILELYLNLAPFGGNVEGLEAAARIYFGKPPASLSLAQLTTLIVIPNRPTSLRPADDNALLLAARNRWLAAFRQQQLFDVRDLDAALTEPLGIGRYSMPRQAPHFAVRMQMRYPNVPRIQAHLSPEIQPLAERQVRAYTEYLRRLGITNAAALVVENRSRHVVAYVGSADVNDNAAMGQVDGVQAVRSPGSALKPLIYALAFDQGFATPRTVVLDAGVNYFGYKPENYNQKFNGPVTLSFALANSLNIPAVKVLDQVGMPLFTDRLINIGFAQIRQDQSRLGLSTALGGCGVRLQEMAGLYCAFANAGVYRPLQYTEMDADTHQVQVVSPAAAWLVTQVLTELSRPDLPNNLAASTDLPLVAWKTGTSYGRRDAWAIGYNNAYTVAVWCGNFSGEGNAALSGADVATPLLFKIFNSLERRNTARAFAKPRAVLSRNVCTVTGLPPDTFCHDLAPDDYIVQVTNHPRCTHKSWVWVNAAQTESYCAACLPPEGAQRLLLPNLPPDVVAYYRENKIPYAAPPPHNPRCTRVAQGTLRITSPAEGTHLYLDLANPRQIALEAQAAADAQTLHWFVQGRYKGSRPSGQPLFLLPDTGRIAISCTDDRGRSHRIEINVHGL
jgi:penicillin-binding protein 1C